MATDHIRYDLLAQEALRGVVLRVLADAAKNGLAGDHHFFISFDTRAAGVRISPRLREKYPEEMTIVLQHQYWDLVVSEQSFEVGLSFNGVPERLAVPFAAIKGFFDPSVQFALQFDVTARQEAEPSSETVAAPPPPIAEPAVKAPRTGRAKKTTVPAPVPAPTAPVPSDAVAESAEAQDIKTGRQPGAEVVRLDRFRKK